MSRNKQWLLSDINVLIIDEEDVFVRRLETYLSRQGATVTLIHDGYQVMEACLYDNPDVVFIDLSLSNRDGIELIRFLGQGPWACIAMSSHSNLDEIRQALRLGACDFLLKPFFDFEILGSVIQTNIQQLPRVKEQQQIAQLQEHFDFFKSHDVAASQLLAQMLPESGQQIGKFLYIHQLKGSTILPLVGGLDDVYTAVAIIDFSLSGSEVAVAAVILNSLLQQAWNAYRCEHDPLAITPHLLMKHLNEMICRAGVKASIGMVYAVLDHENIYSVNAGVLDIKPPFIRSEFGLGLIEHVNYSTHSEKLDSRGFHVSLSNQSGDRLSLKLSPMSY
ncbi:response regulator [Celerinatantimonas sp. YJH-8]|uniref:response regulator n=1 Tax=Celerinatantimonas sp. YJH-8 TaxID=3228714 RepID=UPI0038C222F1